MKKKQWDAIALVAGGILPTIETLVRGAGGLAVYPLNTVFNKAIMKRHKLKKMRVVITEA